MQKKRDTYEASLQSGVVDIREQVGLRGPLAVNSVYLNPASSLAHVDFLLGANTETTIDVVDVTGRVVLSHREVLPAGKHVVDINTEALPHGVYTCRIAAGGQITSRVLSIVR